MTKVANKMRKTPLASRFIQQINRVNDQVCFSALQQWDSNIRLNAIAKNHADAFSTEVFENNPYAKRIHRRVTELPKLSHDAQAVALQSGVVASVEHVLAYVQEVQDFREGLVAETGAPIREDAEEEQLRRKIERWQGAPPASSYFRTMGCLRHLRNHYAHVNEKPTQAFLNYTKSYGAPLNTFWGNRVIDIHGLDFKSLPTIVLTPELAFGIMNLLRVCLSELDQMIADSLPLADKVKWIVMEIRLKPSNRELERGRLARKVRARLKLDWGQEVDGSQVERAIEGIPTALKA